MSAVLAEAELAREAARIVRKLLGGAVLVEHAGGFALARSPGAKPGRVRLEAAAAAAMLARGWLVRGAGALVLSEAGRGWYLRRGAASDPFAAQHRLIRTRKITGADGAPCHVAVNLAESPLAFLAARGLIDADQFAAGERLRRDYTLACLTPRLGVDWSAPCVIGRRAAKPEDFSATVLAAKQRFAAAMRAAGPELAGLLFDLCCDLRGLEECEKSRRWPRASAKVVLRLALDALRRHYGIGLSVAYAKARAWVRAEERSS
jgi:hypothetical protein